MKILVTIMFVWIVLLTLANAFLWYEQSQWNTSTVTAVEKINAYLAK